MKVFISWSGARSKELANALRQWLPMVLQYVEPWVSDKDISAGERWAQSIAGELEAANFGIICITPENLSSEWILFEAGALSKSMLDGKVIPLLFGLELSDLSGPLSQFQAQKVDNAGIMEVIKSINKVAEKPASSQIVDMLVPSLWPQLQETLSKIPEKPPSDKHKRSQHEILEELVTGVRGINSRMREYDPEMMSERERSIRRRRPRFHPHMVLDMAMRADEHDDGTIALLMMSGLVREKFPWLAELLTETYREARKGNHLETDAAFNHLRSAIKQLRHSPFFHEMMGSSKENMMMLEELPMLVEATLERLQSRKGHSKSIKSAQKGLAGA
jgi:hypothetical protein